MSNLAKRLLNNKGLLALTIDCERKELAVALKRDIAPLKLRYLRGSAQKGLRLWDVLSPQLEGYAPNGGLNGYPTFGHSTLIEKGLI